MSDEARRFRAGDVVRHGPSGEKWVLACDEDACGRSGDAPRGRVLPCGWPPTVAEATDCTLATASTDAERREQLERSAKIRPDGGSPDYRATLADHQLAQEDDVEPTTSADQARTRMLRALIALDACDALRIELPEQRRPDERDKRIVWGTFLQIANPHVTLPPSPKHGDS